MSQLQHLLAAPGSGPVNWDLARQVAASQLAGRAATRRCAIVERHAVEEALRLADLWLEPGVARCPSGIQHRRSPGTATSGSTTRSTSGASSATRSPAGWSARWATWCPRRRAPSSARCSRWSPRSAARSSAASSARRSARSPPRCSPPATSACRSARPARPRWSRPTSGRTARAWRSPRTRSASTWPCARRPTSGCSGTSRGCAGTCSTAVETYAAGIRVNREAIEEAMGRVDPTDPESMQAIALEGIFTPGGHPAAEGRPGPAGDRARAGRGLGLPRGGQRRRRTGCPTWSALGEAFRRRRAAGGPAEQTFAALVGLELRPRRLREATALWAALTEHRGIAGRDAVWGHPDLLPIGRGLRRPGGLRDDRLDLDASWPASTSPLPAARRSRPRAAGHRPDEHRRRRRPVLTRSDQPRHRPDLPDPRAGPALSPFAGRSRVAAQADVGRRQPGCRPVRVRSTVAGQVRRAWRRCGGRWPVRRGGRRAGRGWPPSPPPPGPGRPGRPGRAAGASRGDRHVGRVRGAARAGPPAAAVSRSSAGSQPGTGSRHATPSSPGAAALDRRDRDRSGGQRAQQLAEGQPRQVGGVGGDHGGLVVPVAAAASAAVTVGSGTSYTAVPGQRTASASQRSAGVDRDARSPPRRGWRAGPPRPRPARYATAPGRRRAASRSPGRATPPPHVGPSPDPSRPAP